MPRRSKKDAHWFKHYYKGDTMPHSTLRAVLMGGILGMLMAASNLYTPGDRWAFGVATRACVMLFVIWNGFRALSGGRLSEMSILEKNCMPVHASRRLLDGSTIATCSGRCCCSPSPARGRHRGCQTWAVTNWWVSARSRSAPA